MRGEGRLGPGQGQARGMPRSGEPAGARTKPQRARPQPALGWRDLTPGSWLQPRATTVSFTLHNLATPS